MSKTTKDSRATETNGDAAALPPAVSDERWREAQTWEQAFWDRQNIPSPWWKRTLRPVAVLMGLRPPAASAEYDDRNDWWARQFDTYAALPAAFDNALELGCGPYTNVRIIRESRRIAHLHCSDPLAARYVTYANAWLARAHRAGLVSVDFHPAEHSPYRSGYFDLTVMINVLDHVRDATACLAQAIRVTRPGGYLVFGQDLTGEDERRPSNPGHPFVCNHRQLEPILDAACERVLHRIAPREEVNEPQMHYGALAYIGRRRK